MENQVSEVSASVQHAVGSLGLDAGDRYMLWIGIVIYVAVLIGISLIFIVFWHLCKKQFGGITGDLAGFFLQMTELAVLAVCTFGGMLEW